MGAQSVDLQHMTLSLCALVRRGYQIYIDVMMECGSKEEWLLSRCVQKVINQKNYSDIISCKANYSEIENAKFICSLSHR